MAAINATMNGVLIDYYGRTIAGPLKFVGELMYTDRGVGGGPMPPGGGVGDAHPEHPIFYPPGTLPHPEHPIYLPPEGPPPEGPVGDDGFIKSPPPNGGWGYHGQYGWMYDPPAGSAGPKA